MHLRKPCFIFRFVVKLRGILLMACVMLSFASYAQQPAYSILGDEEFRGIQIYDVIQDKELNYWFATNEGLYLYDYYTYKKIECKESKSNSVFNFVMDKDGSIYCHNLNNQIFQITVKECHLFYEMAGDESKADVSLSIADNNYLLVGAAKIIVLDKSGKIITRRNVSGHYLGQAFTTDNSAIQFHMNGCDSVMIYSGGKFSQKRLQLSGTKLNPSTVLKFFRIQDACYALDLKSKVLFSYHPVKFTLKPLPKNSLFDRGGAVRIYEAGNEIWVAGTLPGVVFFTKEENQPVSNFYYEDYFISDVYKDREGNYLLSTFDKGVLVIPDLKVPDVIHSFRDDPVTALYNDESTGLILGTSKGQLLSYGQGKLKQLNSDGKRPIEALYGSTESDLILFDDGQVRAYNKRTGSILTIFEASLKNVAFVSEHVYFLGTNYGIVKTTWQGKNKFTRQLLKGISTRTYSMAYQAASGDLYASTAHGLFRITSSGEIEKIYYRSKPVFSEQLYNHNGQIFAITGSNGILVIEKNRITQTIHPLVNGEPEKLKRLIVYNNTIIANSSSGLYQFDLNGKLLRPLHVASGIASKKIISFTIYNSELWVSHAGGVQKINLDYQQPNVANPLVRFDRIYVNDQLMNNASSGIFKSKQRKVQFFFSSPTLRNRQFIHYHYQLVGYDSKWNSSPYELNQITYNALAPGSYTLQVKAENQGLFSPVITYSFSIAYPFYTNWWFILAVLTLFLLLVTVIYRWQLNAQHKKSQQINELNASRLTAIQSQMNPHFIFNSLNSIQDLILKGDVEHSYSYITTFSDLVRRTLNYSEKDFIDFEQEIKLIELYLSLEKLRFKKDFIYTIELPAEEDFLVPPMLIQPFIENALVHGLLHKQGEKKLKISFELSELLICTIEDNGIGREKAKAIQIRQKKEHESFSGNAIRNRFEILNNIFKGEFGYTYTDVYQNGEPCGTKVTLKIPVKHEF